MKIYHHTTSCSWNLLAYTSQALILVLEHQFWLRYSIYKQRYSRYCATSVNEIEIEWLLLPQICEHKRPLYVQKYFFFGRYSALSFKISDFLIRNQWLQNNSYCQTLQKILLYSHIVFALLHRKLVYKCTYLFAFDDDVDAFFSAVEFYNFFLYFEHKAFFQHMAWYNW